MKEKGMRQGGTSRTAGDQRVDPRVSLGKVRNQLYPVHYV